jgi:hypothetical protein
MSGGCKNENIGPPTPSVSVIKKKEKKNKQTTGAFLEDGTGRCVFL